MCFFKVIEKVSERWVSKGSIRVQKEGSPESVWVCLRPCMFAGFAEFGFWGLGLWAVRVFEVGDSSSKRLGRRVLGLTLTDTIKNIGHSKGPCAQILYNLALK